MAFGLALPVLPWVAIALIRTYLVYGRWDSLLPGLGATVPRRVTMGAHMHLGAAAMLLGALQFCAPLRRRSPTFHRWSGRIVTSLMVLCSMSGLVFICLKGRLVGGYNMSVAFALGGTWFAICAGMCWWTAHARNFERHWAWAVRCYAACLSPFLYRYWYYAAAVLGYDFVIPYSSGRGEACEGHGVCPRYTRSFDALHAWTYWVSSELVAEVLILSLRHAGAPLWKAPAVTNLNATAQGEPSGEGKQSRAARAFSSYVSSSEAPARGRQGQRPPALWVVNSNRRGAGNDNCFSDRLWCLRGGDKLKARHALHRCRSPSRYMIG